MPTVPVSPACCNCGEPIDPADLEPIPVRGLGGVCERCDTELSQARVIFDCTECKRLTHEHHRAGEDLCDDEDCIHSREDRVEFDRAARAAVLGAYLAGKGGVARGRHE